MREGASLTSQLVRAGFRTQSAYPLAALAGVVANSVFGLIKASVLLAAVGAAGGSLRGYDTTTMAAYVWVSQGLIGFIQPWGGSQIAATTRSGQVAIDLTRPVDLQQAHIADDVGRGLFGLIPRTLPTLAVGALTTGLFLPGTAAPYLLGVTSAILAIVLSSACRYALGVLGFWVVDARGLQTLYMVFGSFLAGLFVPLPLMPPWLQTVAAFTPFPSLLMSPVDLLSGRVTGMSAYVVLGQQAFWLAAVWALGAWLTRAGSRRLEIQGG